MKELEPQLGKLLAGEALVAYIITQIPGVYQAALQFSELGEDHTPDAIITFQQLLAEITGLNFEPSSELIIKLFGDYKKDFFPAGKALCDYILSFIRSKGLNTEQITALLKQIVVYLEKRQTGVVQAMD